MPTTPGPARTLHDVLQAGTARFSCRGKPIRSSRTEAAEPWHGSTTLDALALVEAAAMSSEARTPAARVGEVPKSMPGTAREAVRTALSQASGRAVLMDSLRDLSGNTVEPQLQLKRVGFDAPDSLHESHRQLEESVASAAGVPSELLYVSPGGGSGSREAFRRWFQYERTAASTSY